MRKKTCDICGEELGEIEFIICNFCENENIPIMGVKHATKRRENTKKRRQERQKSIAKKRAREMHSQTLKRKPS